MCQICIDWQLGNLSDKEAIRNIGDIIESTESETERDHLWELTNKVLDKDSSFHEWDSDEYTGSLGELDCPLEDTGE